MSKIKKATGFLVVIMALFENEIFARIRNELERLIYEEVIISAIGLAAFNYIQKFFRKRKRRSRSRRRK